jgi:hypothetical protein
VAPDRLRATEQPQVAPTGRSPIQARPVVTWPFCGAALTWRWDPGPLLPGRRARSLSARVLRPSAEWPSPGPVSLPGHEPPPGLPDPPAADQSLTCLDADADADRVAFRVRSGARVEAVQQTRLSDESPLRGVGLLLRRSLANEAAQDPREREKPRGGRGPELCGPEPCGHAMQGMRGRKHRKKREGPAVLASRSASRSDRSVQPQLSLDEGRRAARLLERLSTAL